MCLQGSEFTKDQIYLDERSQKSSNVESKRSQCLHGTPGAGTCREPAREPFSCYFLASVASVKFPTTTPSQIALAITARNIFKSIIFMKVTDLTDYGTADESTPRINLFISSNKLSVIISQKVEKK